MGHSEIEVEDVTTPITLYGLQGVTHGAAKVLTVMSVAGISGIRQAIPSADGVMINSCAGRLVQYFEQRSGALNRLIRAHGIVVLSKPEWDVKKVELGDAIWE